MKKRKRLKGFGDRSKKSTKKKRKNEIKEILKITQKVDQVTSENKSKPRALENFQNLVTEGDVGKLAEYF